MKHKEQAGCDWPLDRWSGNAAGRRVFRTDRAEALSLTCLNNTNKDVTMILNDFTILAGYAIISL